MNRKASIMKYINKFAVENLEFISTPVNSCIVDFDIGSFWNSNAGVNNQNDCLRLALYSDYSMHLIRMCFVFQRKTEVDVHISVRNMRCYWRFLLIWCNVAKVYFNYIDLPFFKKLLIFNLHLLLPLHLQLIRVSLVLFCHLPNKSTKDYWLMSWLGATWPR